MNFIGIFGYSIAAIAYAIFFLLLVVIRKKSFVAILITTIAAVSLLASLLAALQIYFSFSLKNVLIVENIKLIIFLTLLLITKVGMKNFNALIKTPSFPRYVIAPILTSLLCWYLAQSFSSSGKYLFLLFLGLNLAVIVLLEQLYRNSSAKIKWALWPMVIALGTISVVDFVIFAQATMLDQLSFDFWFSRGYIITVGVPFLLITSRRVKEWSVNVFVSRDVVFHSTMLFIAGGYLLVLAFAGYAINLIGGKWGGIFSITFAVLGVVVLATLLLTEKLRREVKVFITKHFFANKYDYRIEWLKSSEQLAISDSSNHYQTAIDIICSSINIHRGLLVKKQSNGQFSVLSEKDFNTEDFSFQAIKPIDKFCTEHGWIIDLREYHYVENSYPNLTIDSDYFRQHRIDLIIPIVTKHELYGLFMLTRGEGREILNWEDRDLLFAITKQLSNYLSLNEANVELFESKQFEAFHRMSAFLVHDLKNVQAQLSLVSSNAEKHRENPAFIDDVFETVTSATERLDKVLVQLRNKQLPEVHQKQLVAQSVIDRVIAQRNINKPRVHAEIDRELTSYVNEELVSVLNHLIQNAQEASQPNDEIIVKAREQNRLLIITVIDQGCGMSDAFIKNRLFKPFDTTKGNAGMGIGVYEAKQYVEGLNGTINVISVENQGSAFTLSIPYKNK